MASATVPRTALPDEELLGLVTLIKDVDTVELKLTVPEPAQLTTARALGRRGGAATATAAAPGG